MTQEQKQNKQTVHSFMSGTEFSYLDKVVRPKDGTVFKIGDLIEWEDLDAEIEKYDEETDEITYKTPQFYQGKIDRIYLIEWSKDVFNIQISLKVPSLGRLDLNDIERIEIK